MCVRRCALGVLPGECRDEAAQKRRLGGMKAANEGLSKTWSTALAANLVGSTSLCILRPFAVLHSSLFALPFVVPGVANVAILPTRLSTLPLIRDASHRHLAK